MIKQRLRLLALICALLPSTSYALLTPFGIEVNNAVEAGLQYLRASQEGNGGWGRPTGLPILCFLERRAGPDWNAPSVGYVGMSNEDKDRVREASATASTASMGSIIQRQTVRGRLLSDGYEPLSGDGRSR